MKEYTNKQPKNTENQTKPELHTDLDESAKIFCAKRNKIREAVDELMRYDAGAEELTAIARLITLVFAETYQDRLNGEGYYHIAMRELFTNHKISETALMDWQAGIMAGSDF